MAWFANYVLEMTTTVVSPVLESTNMPRADRLFGASRCELTLRIGRSRGDLECAEAYVDRLAVYHRNGRRDTYRVKSWVDLCKGLSVVIDAGPENGLHDVVGIGLSWSSPVVCEGEGEVGPFQIEAKPRRTRMRIREGEGKQALSPWRVSQGRALGGAPRLLVELTPVEEAEFEIEPPSRAHGIGEQASEPARSLETVVFDASELIRQD